jgi:hypothetical protein
MTTSGVPRRFVLGWRHGGARLMTRCLLAAWALVVLVTAADVVQANPGH